MNLIQVTRSSMPELGEYVEEIKSMWENHWLTNMGEKHIAFQNLLAQYMGIDKIELVTNGHMALELSLQALDLKGEVITTPFTFASTTHAIVRNGLEPVFCDINSDDYTIDTTKIEKLITSRTSAIMPVHVYGNICAVEEIQRIANKYGLKVIYDAAHTFGETYHGKSLGCYGDVTCFSFHATKVFNSIEGGAVCFQDKEFGLKIYQLKNFGIQDEETVSGVGANAKMNEFCAAMGICNLRHIDDEIQKRKKIHECYNERLKSVKGIRIRTIPPDTESNYSYYPIYVDELKYGRDRDWLYTRLKDNGIIARKYFFPLTSAFQCFEGKFNPHATPNALSISKRILTLPMYADLDIVSVNRICDIICASKF